MCHQLKITLPSLVFAFAVFLVVPSIEVLVTLGTALTIVPGGTWLLSLLWFLGDNKEVNTNIYLHSISISAGGVMTVVAIASGVNGFISADFYGNHLWSFTRKYRTTARDAIYLNEYIVISE